VKCCQKINECKRGSQKHKNIKEHEINGTQQFKERTKKEKQMNYVQMSNTKKKKKQNNNESLNNNKGKQMNNQSLNIEKQKQNENGSSNEDE